MDGPFQKQMLMVTSSLRALRHHCVPHVFVVSNLSEKKEIKICAVADLRVNFSVIHHESHAATPTTGSLQAISDNE